MDEIHLLRNNEKVKKSDLEWLEQFYSHLKDDLKFSPKKAFSVIYYLQEHLCVFPDTIEQCNTCNSLYDTNRSGFYSEKKGKFYCDNCMESAPEKVRREAGYY